MMPFNLSISLIQRILEAVFASFVGISDFEFGFVSQSAEAAEVPTLVLSYVIRMAQRTTISETMLLVFYLVNESLANWNKE